MEVGRKGPGLADGLDQSGSQSRGVGGKEGSEMALGVFAGAPG